MSSMISWLRAPAASRRWLGEARYAGARKMAWPTRPHPGTGSIGKVTALVDGELCIPTILSEGTHFSERDGRAPTDVPATAPNLHAHNADDSASSWRCDAGWSLPMALSASTQHLGARPCLLPRIECGARAAWQEVISGAGILSLENGRYRWLYSFRSFSTAWWL